MTSAYPIGTGVSLGAGPISGWITAPVPMQSGDTLFVASVTRRYGNAVAPNTRIVSNRLAWKPVQHTEFPLATSYDLYLHRAQARGNLNGPLAFVFEAGDVDFVVWAAFGYPGMVQGTYKAVRADGDATTLDLAGVNLAVWATEAWSTDSLGVLGGTIFEKFDDGLGAFPKIVVAQAPAPAEIVFQAQPPQLMAGIGLALS